MTATLETLAPCFQGIIPAELVTCSGDGIPNTALLSHVDYVDAKHVALSFQFFNKSRRNVAENPYALVRVIDPDTSQGWMLRLRFTRSETEGPLFERMNLRIEAIASYCGLKGVFKLRAADVYEVLSIAPVLEEPGVAAPEDASHQRTADPVFTIQAMQDLSARIHRADSLEGLLDSILEALEVSFGFTHSLILLPAEERDVLVAIATRGYAESGVGAEAHFGEGIVGLVAEAKKPIRISGLARGMLYAHASQQRTLDPRAAPPVSRIPLPGLAAPESQLGVPLLVRGELVGVLCLESEVPYRFHEEDKASIELLGGYLAIAIQHIQLQERAASEAYPLAAPPPSGPREGGGDARRDLVYYESDECILVDGEYLIRSLPARILWKLLTCHQEQGRTEFTNRELRLDKSLKLPEWKDNLETRLLLLRRRLEQKCPDIRLVPRTRGRFALEVGCGLALGTRP